MKTKKQILEEISKKGTMSTSGFTPKDMLAMEEAIKNEDLLAIASNTLAEVLVDGVLHEGYIIQSEEERRLVLFKTIFATFKIVRDAEEAFEAQFKVEEKKL
ncbi:hypothetical protein LCGC14_0958200 [marine sediment metagenome]|uniref:Uncharacterized protein n=1 Tax=marine sediment metagenome TaxID=412755 RepID=A0A0F9NJU5_9ZZZZ